MEKDIYVTEQAQVLKYRTHRYRAENTAEMAQEGWYKSVGTRYRIRQAQRRYVRPHPPTRQKEQRKR
jgi:hypothetical protein